jgi:hypothetical protein
MRQMRQLPCAVLPPSHYRRSDKFTDRLQMQVSNLSFHGPCTSSSVCGVAGVRAARRVHLGQRTP